MMNQEDYTSKVNDLHTHITELIANDLSPVSLKYGFSDVSLETKIKWKPIVLILGNYSSGKSTLINDFLGKKIQNTGQAPTDDCFTVMTSEKESNTEGQSGVLYEKTGHSLFSNPKYPFSLLKKHGDTLASHFRMKTIDSPKLENLAIIDTPGMLDSTTEKDRGYHYQEVVGELASFADVVLVLFDAHKAGTVKEVYQSLRETLPERVFEDRITYVLNRIDECSSLEDMIRVYGTLCWNLSQITGRKDIPRILLSYSQDQKDRHSQSHDYLKHLENQQNELKKTILRAPQKRLDHLANFFEDQSLSLMTLLGSLLEFTRRKRRFYVKNLAFGISFSFLLTFLSAFFLGFDLSSFSSPLVYICLIGSVALSYLSFLFSKLFLFPRFLRKLKKNLESLNPAQNQSHIDTWNKIKSSVESNLDKNQSQLSYRQLSKELKKVEESHKKNTAALRTSLDELNQL